MLIINPYNMEQNDQNAMGTKCSCPHHKMIPGLIVLFGLLFFLEAMNALSSQFVSAVWPVLVIIGGLQKMFGGNCKCCKGCCK